MARRSRTGAKASAAKTRKAAPSKGPRPRQHQAPDCAKRRAIETFHESSDLGEELKEAREQQAATADDFESDRLFALGRAAGVRCDRGERQPSAWRVFQHRLPLHRRHGSPEGLHANDAGSRRNLAVDLPATGCRFRGVSNDSSRRGDANSRHRSSRRTSSRRLRGRAATAACCMLR